LRSTIRLPLNEQCWLDSHDIDPRFSGANYRAEVTRYVVHSGDTLWSAAHHLAPDADPREVVDALIQARGDRALMPGDVLRWQR
jgi:hypothetical protein